LDIITTTDTCTRAVGVYILDDRIVTVIRHPRDAEGNFITTLFIRDATGRYCWNTTLLFDPLPEVLEPISSPELSPLPQPAAEPVNEALKQNIFSFLSEEEKARHARLLPRLDQLVAQENQKLSSQGYNLNTSVAVRPPNLPLIEAEHDTTASRLLLSHLGWSDANYRLRFFFVKDITVSSLSPASTVGAEELKSLFGEIDSIQERHQYSCSIFYVSGTYPTDHSIFSEQSPSPAFVDFVKDLGSTIDLKKHHGFVGGLLPSLSGDEALYYANHSTELIYHVATKLPYTSTTEQQYKRKLLLEDKVAIVWIDGISEFKGFDFVKDSLAHTLIILSPMCSQLVRVQIMRRPDTSLSTAQSNSICGSVGPLMGEFIITRNSLAPLVRITALNTLSAHSHSDRPFIKRQKAISEFIKKHKNDKASAQVYYCQQFA
jgi:hypothetical protein